MTIANEPKYARFELRVQPSLVKMVDEWRRKQPDIPTRAEAIRRLIEKGIQKGK